MSNDPFSINNRLLAWLLSLDECRAVYRASQVSRGDSFADRVLEALSIRAECESSELERIPKTGPIIVAANHPHGGVDGLLLASLLGRARPDVRIVANHLLSRIPE